MRWMLMAACASLMAGHAAAQTIPADLPACGGIGAARAAGDSAAIAAAPTDSAARPIISLDARFTAESIRLNAPSSARVVLPSCAPGTGVRVERQNLPERLEPGTTYRNGGIRILIQADAAIACRLAAALNAPAGTSAAAGLDDAICGAASPPAPSAAAASSPASPVGNAPNPTSSAPATPSAAAQTPSAPQPTPSRP